MFEKKKATHITVQCHGCNDAYTIELADAWDIQKCPKCGTMLFVGKYKDEYHGSVV